MYPSGFKVIRLIPIIFILFICFGSLRAEEKPIPVFVSIQPQAYFVERIGGDRVLVDVLVLPGKNPASYAPTPAQMAKLSKAKIFFRIGVPFENALMPKIVNTAKKLQIIDTRKGIQLRRMEGRHHNENVTLGHDTHGTHDHQHEAGGNDPHIWLNPMLVKKQAETIYNALVKLDPMGKSEYSANFNGFISNLDALHGKIQQALAPVKGETIFVFHPSFGYFTDAYGLKQMAVEMEGKTPKGKDLVLFIKKAKKEAVRVVFVQPQFDSNAAKNIARAIHGAVVSLNPLARDYIHNLEVMAGKVSDALKTSN